jgi:hypothetical protein
MERANNRTIQQWNDPTMERSNNGRIQQWNDPTICDLTMLGFNAEGVR